MTAAELINTWTARDNLYRMRKIRGAYTSLDEREQECVVWWRRKEAEALDGRDRVTALAALSLWTPPIPTR